jgi:hypothetical protein
MAVGMGMGICTETAMDVGGSIMQRMGLAMGAGKVTASGWEGAVGLDMDSAMETDTAAETEPNDYQSN